MNYQLVDRGCTKRAVDLLSGQSSKSLSTPFSLVYHYEAFWMSHIQPQGKDFRYEEIAFRFYEAIRGLGLDVDFLPPVVSRGYKLVIVPPLSHVSDEAQKAFRTRSCTLHLLHLTLHILFHLPPPIARLTFRLLFLSLRPNLSAPVRGVVNGLAKKWREYLETGANALAQFANGDAAFTANGKHHYLACVPDEKLLVSVMAHVSQTAGLKITVLPPHIRLRQRGNLVFGFNYGDVSWRVPKGKELVLGKQAIAPQSLSIWLA